MKTIILGGGVAGLSLAYFLEGESIVLERESQTGGLCRSYQLNGIDYDIGPHIMFSKNQEILDLHCSLVDTNRIRRSNQIFHDGRFVKYPFENDLAALGDDDRDYCLKEFLNNPYEDLPAGNMLQFFLKTFGEGITRLYLQPYNEKIWKYDPSCLDTQMVERIPKPPREDVIKSAEGVATEGYTHQLYFHYPSEGGFQALPDAYRARLGDRTEVLTSVTVQSLQRDGAEWVVTTDRGTFRSERLVSCIPVHELFRYLEPPVEVQRSLDRLLWNSLYTIVIQAKKDRLGDNLAIFFADPSVLFHRVTKVNFLGEAYRLPDDATTLLVEVTYRPGSYLASLDEERILERVLDDFERLALLSREDVLATEIKSHLYAYVIYALDHRENTDRVLAWLREQGIGSNGRFAEFEYRNSDAIAACSQQLAAELEAHD